jgi:hypothetical protein
MEGLLVNPKQQVAEELFGKFLNTLEQAAFEAKQIHSLGQEDGIEWKGTEGLDVAGKLREIYAAFSTGNKRDFTFNDEIFK